MMTGLAGVVNTGDTSKPWLIAICMIMSVVLVVGMFILGQNDKEDEEDSGDDE